MINAPSEIAKQVSSNVAVITLRKDDMITFEPHKGVHEHNLATMKFELNQFIKWSEERNKKLLFLCDNRNLKKFDHDVKNYTQENLHKFSAALALIVESGISSFLTNIFIHLHRPNIPIKTFTHQKDAINWLKSLKL